MYSVVQNQKQNRRYLPHELNTRINAVTLTSLSLFSGLTSLANEHPPKYGKWRVARVGSAPCGRFYSFSSASVRVVRSQTSPGPKYWMAPG